MTNAINVNGIEVHPTATSAAQADLAELTPETDPTGLQRVALESVSDHPDLDFAARLTASKMSEARHLRAFFDEKANYE